MKILILILLMSQVCWADSNDLIMRYDGKYLPFTCKSHIYVQDENGWHCGEKYPKYKCVEEYIPDKSSIKNCFNGNIIDYCVQNKYLLCLPIEENK